MKDTLRRHSFHSENGSKDSYQDDVEHSPSAAFLPPSSTNNGHHTHSNKSHTWYMISRRSCLFGLLLLCIPLFYLTVPSITRELHHIMPLTIRHRRAPSVLVTGAMGNIGKYVIVELMKAGYGVIALDVRDKSDELHELLDSRLPRWREGIIPSYKYVQGDIRNTSCISDLLLDPANEVRGVIHLAAVSRVIYCVQNEVDCADVNTFGTESILNAISSYEKKKDVAAGKLWLLFTSSREVFGGACSLEHPCDETAAITPINLYGKSKYESEVLIRERKTLLKGYLILRLASVYGGLYDLPGRLIPQLAIKSMTDRVIDIVGGSQSFDFVHVADVVSSIMKGTDILMRKKGEKFQEEVLICSGHNTAVPQVIDFTRKHSSSQSPLRFGLADLSYPDKFVCGKK